MKKIVIIVVSVLVVLGVIGGAAFYLLGTDGTSADEVAYVTSVADLTGAGSSMNNRYIGVVETQETWELQQAQEKTVDEILVEEGDMVEVGTPLFSYDTDEMETKVSQAELEIERIDIEISNSEKKIEDLKKEEKKAKSDEKLGFTMQIQEEEMEIKRHEYEKRSKSVEIEQLKKSIENSTVTSELSGIVKSINENGEMNMDTGQTDPFMTIMTIGDFRIKGTVSEQNIVELYEELPVIIRSRTNEEQTWRGVISSIDYDNPNANENSWYSSGETSTTYPFYVDLDSSQDLILGQHVHIEMDMGQDEVREGLWLDEFYFVMEEDGSAYIWTADENEKLEKRAVTLGEYDEELFCYEIIDGITESDAIAFPQDYLKEGMAVSYEAEVYMEDDFGGEDMNFEDEDMNFEGEGMDDGMMDGEIIGEEGMEVIQ